MMLNRLISFMFAVMLALTSQSMAVARGASAATGQMVLCTGTGPMAVYMDAQGQPTKAPHICPDSALNVVGGGAAPEVVAPARMVQFYLPIGVIARRAPAYPHPAPPSTGPPASV